MQRTDACFMDEIHTDLLRAGGEGDMDLSRLSAQGRMTGTAARPGVLAVSVLSYILQGDGCRRAPSSCPWHQLLSARSGTFETEMVWALLV